jgi:hypothetical protein
MRSDQRSAIMARSEARDTAAVSTTRRVEHEAPMIAIGTLQGAVHRVARWLVMGLVLLIAHDAVFIVQHGPGRGLTAALQASGHGYWTVLSVLLVIGGLAAAGLWLGRLALLRRAAGAAPGRRRTERSWLRRGLGDWPRILLLVATVFVLQENAEHFLAHGHVIGLGALAGPEYPLAMPVLAFISGLAGLVLAAFRHKEAELLRRLHAALARPRPDRGDQAPRAAAPTLYRGPLIASNRALRAPPAHARLNS